jgi:hypothetical protein
MICSSESSPGRSARSNLPKLIMLESGGTPPDEAAEIPGTVFNRSMNCAVKVSRAYTSA